MGSLSLRVYFPGDHSHLSGPVKVEVLTSLGRVITIEKIFNIFQGGRICCHF